MKVLSWGIGQPAQRLSLDTDSGCRPQRAPRVPVAARDGTGSRSTQGLQCSSSLGSIL